VMLKLTVGSSQRPQEGKINKSGEDSLFLSSPKNPSCQCLAVFDGVGGWAKEGVDASAYSQALAKGVGKGFAAGTLNPTELLQHAYESASDIVGTSAACVTVFNNNTLQICNLGDSKVIVVRDSKNFFASEEQQVEWNTPYQIGTGSSHTPKTHSKFYNVQLKEKDYIVLATDGLFDNLSHQDIIGFVKPTVECQAVAQLLVEQSFKVSTNTRANTPFAKDAKKAGKSWQGGKTDDITVIFARVQ